MSVPPDTTPPDTTDRPGDAPDVARAIANDTAIVSGPTQTRATHGARRGRSSHPVRWAALAVVVVIMLLLGVVFGLRLARGPVPIHSAIIGQRAPNFDLPGLRGGRVRSAGYDGKMYIVNFWASWCVPCRKEALLLEAFAKEWAGHVTVIGIDWNDTPGAANDFVREFGLTYPQVVDTDSRLAIRYGTTGVPETYLVTPEGVVAAGVIGAVGPNTLDDMVASVNAGREGVSRGGDHRSSP